MAQVLPNVIICDRVGPGPICRARRDRPAQQRWYCLGCGIRRRMILKGKTAIGTGSTSGIGLGIATALTAEGYALMLNGFGDPGEIEKLRVDLTGKK
jgi:hypothetical protein